jgi:hypothetical protein
MARIALYYGSVHLQDIVGSRLAVGAIRTAETILPDWGKRGTPEDGPEETGERAQEFRYACKDCLLPTVYCLLSTYVANVVK